jgi:hypothetical protein
VNNIKGGKEPDGINQPLKCLQCSHFTENETRSSTL